MEIAKKINIVTVKDLRDAIKDMGDDAGISFQVVGQKSGAWNMACDFTHTPLWGHFGGILALSHPELTHLPMQWDNTALNAGPIVAVHPLGVLMAVCADNNTVEIFRYCHSDFSWQLEYSEQCPGTVNLAFSYDGRILGVSGTGVNESINVEKLLAR